MFFSVTLKPLRLFAGAAVFAALAGCASAPPTTFDLSAAPAARVSGGGGVLVIGEPVSVSLLDSERIVVRTAGGGVAYLPGAQWADRLPRLLQSRLVQSFENARRVGTVGRPGDRLVASAQLNTEIRAFEVQEKSGEAVVELSAKLVNDRTGRVLAGQLFSVRAPVSSISGPAAARALDEALQAAMAQMIVWASRRG